VPSVSCVYLSHNFACNQFLGHVGLHQFHALATWCGETFWKVPDYLANDRYSTIFICFGTEIHTWQTKTPLLVWRGTSKTVEFGRRMVEVSSMEAMRIAGTRVPLDALFMS